MAIEEALQRPRGARFWKCAFQVNPASYLGQYGGQDHGLDADEYNAKLVAACHDNDIEVIGLADHGSVENIDGLRAMLSSAGVTVFPGFEVASTEKIHMVCLFEPDVSQSDLLMILGKLVDRGKAGTEPSRLGCLEIARIVLEEGGVWFAAHMTGKNGLLRLTGDGDNHVHVWRDEDHVLAGQIPGPLEDLVPPEELDAATDKHAARRKYADIVRNKNPGYERQRPVALLNAKDVKRPEDLAGPSASCFVKMTNPSIAALHQALMDPDSRIVLSEAEQVPRSRITAVAWEGGYLDGLRIRFADGLNTIIGGRGTGKSTIIESIRYALELEPRGEDAQKAHREVIKANLGREGGRVHVQIVSGAQMGNTFTVTRRHGDPAVVSDAGGNPSTLSVSDLLPRVAVLGQNEILQIAGDDDAKLGLVQRFLPDAGANDATIQELRQRLAQNRKELLGAYEDLSSVEDDLAELPKLREQAQLYEKEGIAGKLALAKQLGREHEHVKKLRRQLNTIETATTEAISALPDSSDLPSDGDLQDLPNADALTDMRKIVADAGSASRPWLEKVQEELVRASAELDEREAGWKVEYEESKKELDEAIASLPDTDGRSGAEVGTRFVEIAREIERLGPMEGDAAARRASVDRLSKARAVLRRQLEEAEFEKLQALQKAAKKLNAANLKGKLRINIVPRGDRTALADWLLKLPGIGAKKLEWIESADSLSNGSLTSAIDAGEAELRKAFGMGQAAAGALASLSPEQRLELEEIPLAERVVLELNVSHDGEEFRASDGLSTGQRCTAVLHLLLLDAQDEPLLIDQPEDHLDNAFIAERIVAELRRAKTRRQFVFTTHNANIPVFGDAEWIGALDEVEHRGVLLDEYVGSIDDPTIQKRASHILEGGKEAFEARKRKYGYG